MCDASDMQTVGTYLNKFIIYEICLDNEWKIVLYNFLQMKIDKMNEYLIIKIKKRRIYSIL